MRKQLTFAGLTDDEINQVAEWLLHGTYDQVRKRLAKPRPEGFALVLKSNRPLETLWKKKYTIDQINRRLQSGPNLTLVDLTAMESGKIPSSLASAEIPPPPVNTGPAREAGNPPQPTSPGVSTLSDPRDFPASALSPFSQLSPVQLSKLVTVHTAIIETAHDLAKSGDNNPYQLLALQKLADFPARAHLRARKEQRTEDLHTCKLEMAAHRKQIATERLELFRRSLELREKQFTHKSRPNSETATGWTPEQFLKIRAMIDSELRIPLEELDPTGGMSLASPAFDLSSSANESLATNPTTNSAPSAVEIPSLSPSSPFVERPTPREAPESKCQMTDAQRVAPKSDEGGCSMLNEKPHANCSVLDQTPSSFPSFPSVENSAIRDPQSAMLVSHALRRWRAHIPRPADSPEPDTSWRNECPCGHQLPCPKHPELAAHVRGYRPQSPSYAEELTRAGVPVYLPTPEELGCPRELYERSLQHHHRAPHIPAELLPFIDPCQSNLITEEQKWLPP